MSPAARKASRSPRSVSSSPRPSASASTLDNYFSENKTIFADAPQNLVPVVLNYYTGNTHLDIVHDIEAVVREFSTLLGGL